MKIAIPKEQRPDETRVAASPETVKKLISLGFEVAVEKGAGLAAAVPDEAFEKAGAQIAADATVAFGEADIIAKVRRPLPEETKGLKAGALVISIMDPFRAGDELKPLQDCGVTAFAMDLIPRITRAQSMDVLSSQSNLAGYKAVLDAAAVYGSAFPQMMTAAGTVPPAKALVMGAGVAGLQAIATAKRLGAIVSATDVRPAAKEQVESLGADFIEIEVPESDTTGDSGYAKAQSEAFYTAQRQQLADCVARADLVITTAAVPGKPAPKLIDQEMIHRMKSGSVIVDLAADKGGNVDGTVLNQKVDVDGVTLVGHANHPSRVPVHASQLLTRNITAFLLNMTEDGRVVPKLEDEIVAATLVVQHGSVRHNTETRENPETSTQKDTD